MQIRLLIKLLLIEKNTEFYQNNLFTTYLSI